MALPATGLGEDLRSRNRILVVREALALRPLGDRLPQLRPECLLRGGALVGQGAHRDDDDHHRDESDRSAQQAALAAEVDERQRDQDREQDVRDADRAENDRVGPLENPEQVEEEVEEPVRAGNEVGRARVGFFRVVGPEQTGVVGALGCEVPHARERHDHADDHEAHHRVVEHGVREERLPLALDVLLVALVVRLPFLDPPASHPRLHALRAGGGRCVHRPGPAPRRGRAPRPRQTTAAR